MGPMKWRERGRCKGVEPSVFYPEDDEDPAEEAKHVCATCAVREACLEYALAGREKIGVWGGYTARERRRLVRQRRRAS
jgi:WhiB family transcriptional regulator, redox-sensing transcriptional regulator